MAHYLHGLNQLRSEPEKQINMQKSPFTLWNEFGDVLFLPLRWALENLTLPNEGIRTCRQQSDGENDKRRENWKMQKYPKSAYIVIQF